jgi:hypothetical protein
MTPHPTRAGGSWTSGPPRTPGCGSSTCREAPGPGRPGCVAWRHRPDGYRDPPGLRGLKTALISRDAYWAYAMLAPANNARVAAGRLLGRAR